MRIKKGDSVMIMAGKDKGKTGKVERAFPKEGKVIVERLNLRKYHQRPKRSDQKGQIVEKSMPIQASNVMILDSKSGKPTRIGVRFDEKGRRQRVAKKTGTVLD